MTKDTQLVKGLETICWYHKFFQEPHRAAKGVARRGVSQPLVYKAGESEKTLSPNVTLRSYTVVGIWF